MYTKIHDDIWSMAKRKEMNKNEIIVYIYLFSCPHRTILGLFKLPLAYIAEDLGFSLPLARKIIISLQNKKLIEYDKTNSLILVKGFLKYNEIPNRNVEKKAVKIVEGVLPNTPLWEQMMSEITPYREKLCLLFDVVLKRYCKQYGKEYSEQYGIWYGNTDSRQQKAEYRQQTAASSKQNVLGAEPPKSAADAAEKRCNKILDECRSMFPDLTGYQETSLAGYLETLGAEVVQEAIQKAGRSGARSWAYLDTILADWVSNGPPVAEHPASVGTACSPGKNTSMREDMDWMDQFLAKHGEGEDSP